MVTARPRKRALIEAAALLFFGVNAAHAGKPLPLSEQSAYFFKDQPYNPLAAFGSLNDEECGKNPPRQLKLAQELNPRRVIESADPLPTPKEFQAERDTFIPVLLTPKINEITYDDPGLFLIKRCGTLLVREEDLYRWRIVTETQEKIIVNGVAFINIGKYAGLRYDINPSLQSIIVEGEPFIFYPTVIDFDQTKYPEPDKVIPGGFFNYRVGTSGVLRDPNQLIGGSFNIGAFAEPGVIISNWGWSYDFKSAAYAFQRGSTTLNRDFNQSALTLQLGDVQSPSGPLGGGFELAGISIGKNFGIQPGRITTPVDDQVFALRRRSLLNIFATRLFPEPFERGGSLFSSMASTLPHGPLEVRNFPSNGNATYFYDFFGQNGRRDQLRNKVYYNSGILRKGLYEYQYTAGFVRRGLDGLRGSDTYKDLAFGTRHRYGLGQYTTISAQFETAKDKYLATAEVSQVVPYLGVVDVSAGQTWGSGQNRSSSRRAFGGSISNVWSSFGYNLNRTYVSQNFGTVRNFDPENRLKSFSSASIYATMPWQDTVTANYGDLRAREEDSSSRDLDIEYRVNRFRNIRLSFYARKTFDRGQDFTYGFTLGSSFRVRDLLNLVGIEPSPLKERSSDYQPIFTPDNTSIGYGINSDFEQIAGGIGLGSSGRYKRHTYGININQNGRFQDRYIDQPLNGSIYYSYRSPYIEDFATVTYNRGNPLYNLGLNGSVFYVKKRFLFSPSSFGSFALVDLGKDMAGAKVNGFETDSDGVALVSGLQPYALNRLFIGLENAPLNMRPQDFETFVVPRTASAVSVTYKLPFVIDAALTVLVQNREGKLAEPPLSASAKIVKTDQENRPVSPEIFPFGDKGYLYLSGLGRVNQVEIRWRGGRCLLNLEIPPATQRDEIPDLGTQICKELP